MEEVGADALAHSQLALLRKLGLIEQDAGEENEDPHAFLNRLPPPSSPEAPFFYSQSSGDQANESIHKPFNHSRLTLHASIRPVSIAQSIREIQRPLTAVRPLLDSPPGLHAKPLSTANDEQQTKQRWFRLWRRRVEVTHLHAEAQARGRRLTKRRILSQWQNAVYRTKLHQSKTHMMVRWKARRSLQTWRDHATIRGRVRWLLAAKGRQETLVTRLRRQRTWRRWRLFVQVQQSYQDRIKRMTTRRRRRVCRSAWIEWRVLVFQRHAAQATYRRFFESVRLCQQEFQSKIAVASDGFDQCCDRRRHELFRRWWSFVVSRQRDRVRVWRIQMVMIRGKYFTVWHSAFDHAQRIHALRQRVRERGHQSHFRAWHLVAVASALGRSSRLWNLAACKARYLEVWKTAVAQCIRCRRVTEVIHLMRKARVVAALRAWSIRHGEYATRLCAADAVARRRTLLRVWTNGLVPFHLQRKHENQMQKKVEAIVLSKVFAVWNQTWIQRHRWRERKRRAERMAVQSQLRFVWNGWRSFIRWRQQHKTAMITASLHHTQRQMMSGLVVLSNAVSRRSEHTSIARRIRIKQRQALKLRVFFAWRQQVDRQKSLDQKYSALMAKSWFAPSTWNRQRRRWIQWRRYVNTQRVIRRMERSRRETRLRRVVEAWRRVNAIKEMLRMRDSQRRQKTLQFLFRVWVDRSDAWATKETDRLRAASFFRYRLAQRALREWHSLVHTRLKRLRSLHHCVATNQDQRVIDRSFKEWRWKFLRRHGILSLVARRHLVWLQVCWDAWMALHHYASLVKRKLRYFRQVYGRYPTTSLLYRAWSRWRAITVHRQTIVKWQNSRDQRRLGRVFQAWKLRMFAKRVLGAWHTISIATSAMNSDLGRRRRLFYQRQKRRLLQTAFMLWVMARRTSATRRDRTALARSCLPRDIPRAYQARLQLRRHHLRLWFHRWRRRQLSSQYGAVAYHRRCLLRGVLVEWWRAVVHRKQERVLQQARETMGSLSVFKTADRRVLSPRSSTSTTKKNSICTVQEMSKPASGQRMVDPLVRRQSYARTTRETLRQSHHTTPRSVSRTMATRYETQQPTASHRATQETGIQSILKPVVRRRVDEPVVRVLEVAATRPLSSPGDLRATMHAQVSSQVSTSRRPRPSIVEELPLWDSDDVSDKGKSSMQALGDAPQPQTPVQPSTPIEANFALSLESIAAMDPYSPRKNHASDHLSLEQLPPPPPPPRPPPSSTRNHSVPRKRTSDTPKEEPRVTMAPRTRGTSARPRPVESTRPPQAVKGKSPSLAELLEVPDTDPSGPGSMFRHVLKDMSTTCEDFEEPSQLVDSIVEYYASRVHGEQAFQNWGFCMLRDLGLLANDAYVTVFNRVSYHVLTSHRTPHEMIRSLLVQFISSHPKFLSASSNGSDPLTWLIQVHLTKRLGKHTMAARERGVCWIRHPLPTELVLSLDKLGQCIKKYHKQLSQFFWWRPASASASSRCDWMDVTTFVHLMKHCHVHPQLFDRRELEAAAERAGSRHRGARNEVTLTFPEFVEALMRCSQSLQWVDGASRGSLAPETIVVIKFVMLLFVMEGKGSLLSKRSEDLEVVLGLLRRHQHEEKNERLRRFQGLLRQDKTSARRGRPRHHPPATAFRGAMARAESNEASQQYDPPNHVTSAGYTASTNDGGWGANFSTGSEADALELMDTTLQRVKNRMATRDDDASVNRENSAGSGKGAGTMHASSQHWSDTPQIDVLIRDHDDIRGHDAIQATDEDNPQRMDRSSDGHHTGIVLASLRGPMDRDAFLDEILSTINDVELLLLHSESKPPPAYMESDLPSRDATILTSEPFSIAHAARYSVVMGGEPPTIDGDNYDVVIDDINVHDPLLDRLTFADRFTESTDWRADLTITELSEHGIYAASPSTRYTTNPLESGELEDLTAPLPARAYLRSDDPLYRFVGDRFE